MCTAFEVYRYGFKCQVQECSGKRQRESHLNVGGQSGSQSNLDLAGAFTWQEISTQTAFQYCTPATSQQSVSDITEHHSHLSIPSNFSGSQTKGKATIGYEGTEVPYRVVEVEKRRKNKASCLPATESGPALDAWFGYGDSSRPSACHDHRLLQHVYRHRQNRRDT
jgi:hypothetical protein